MQSEGFRNIVRGLILAGTILAASQAAAAQQTFILQIHMDENGQSPMAFTPSQIRHAYGFDLVTNQGAGQTIALVDAYDDANAANDLAVFSKQFNLPPMLTGQWKFHWISNGRTRSRRKPRSSSSRLLRIT